MGEGRSDERRQADWIHPEISERLLDGAACGQGGICPGTVFKKQVGEGCPETEKGFGLDDPDGPGAGGKASANSAVHKEGTCGTGCSGSGRGDDGLHLKGEGDVKKIVRKLLFAVVGMVLVMLMFHFFPINITPSMPYGVYMRLPAWNIKEGDLVELDNPLAPGTFGVYNSGGLLKMVESVTEDGLYVVKGDHPYSYDSRYFGAVGRDYIKHKLVPVFTFKELPDWLKEKEKGNADEQNF